MSVIWKDGQFIDAFSPQVFHNDTGFSNALGVFDSMLADNGVLIDAKAHFERLTHDAETVLGIGASWLPGFTHMTEAWQPLLEKNNLSKGHARIKTIITGGISDSVLRISDVPTVMVIVSKSPAPDSFGPIACKIIPDHRRIAGDALENCKRLDYSRSFAARRKAQEHGAEDAILLNTDGNVACGATSNLFIREGGKLITPPLIDGILDGIMRKNILRDADTFEESISAERLRKAEEIYLCNSFTGLRKALLVD
jgi:branched-chain amino acid aminotransferase